jgi:uncharacterized coiled-coil protein SlyX
VKRLLDWLRNWLCSDLEERHGVLIGRLEQQISEQNQVILELTTSVNKLVEHLSERQAELPTGRRVARTFSEFRAAAEGRPQEKR